MDKQYFKSKICCFCKNYNSCNYIVKIEEKYENKITTLKCNSYILNSYNLNSKNLTKI